MARVAKRIVMVLMLAVVCAACRVDIQVDVSMDDDGSGTVTVTATADADVVARSPNLATDLRFDDVRAAGWTVTGPAPTAGGGLQVTMTHAFTTPDEANALLADIGGDSGPFVNLTLGRSVVKKTTTFTLNGMLQAPTGLDAFSDAELTAAVGATPFAAQVAGAGLQPGDALGITFNADLPGDVNTTTAASGEALTWQVPFDGTAVDVATLSESEDTRNSWASPLARGARIALIVWAVISVCFIAYVLWARRRQRIENQPWY